MGDPANFKYSVIRIGVCDPYYQIYGSWYMFINLNFSYCPNLFWTNPVDSMKAPLICYTTSLHAKHFKVLHPHQNIWIVIYMYDKFGCEWIFHQESALCSYFSYCISCLKNDDVIVDFICKFHSLLTAVKFLGVWGS